MSGVRSLGSVLAVLGLLAGLATGCGDDDPGDGASPSEEPTATESGTEDPTPTESETPTGESMVAENAYVVAPAGWKVKDEGELGLVTAREPRGIGAVHLADYGTVGSTTLRELVDIAGLSAFDGKPKVSFDADLGGAPAYRAAGRGGSGLREEYAAVEGGVAVRVAIVLDPDLPAAERKQLVESVLASFRWT